MFLRFCLTLWANNVLLRFFELYFLFRRFFFFIYVKIPSEIHVFFVWIAWWTFTKLEWRWNFRLAVLTVLREDAPKNKLHSDEFTRLFRVSQNLLFSLEIDGWDSLFELVKNILLLKETQALAWVMSWLHLLQLSVIFTKYRNILFIFLLVVSFLLK